MKPATEDCLTLGLLLILIAAVVFARMKASNFSDGPTHGEPKRPLDSGNLNLTTHDER